MSLLKIFALLTEDEIVRLSKVKGFFREYEGRNKYVQPYVTKEPETKTIDTPPVKGKPFDPRGLTDAELVRAIEEARGSDPSKYRKLLTELAKRRRFTGKKADSKVEGQ